MSRPPPGNQPILTLEGISKRWGELDVLDHADLIVTAGRLVWLTGANGVGKTTLLRIAGGLLLPETGRVSLHGLTPNGTRRAFHQRLGFLSAGNTGLYARLTVRQNLEFVAGLAFLAGARRREAIDKALRRFDLLDLESRRVDRLSMGQRQRVRLSITFLHAPTVVLLDEPRTSLDDEGLRMVRGALEELLARGGGAIWCSPGGDEALLGTADRYVVEHGKVRAC